jgi:hypothetical protein
MYETGARVDEFAHKINIKLQKKSACKVIFIAYCMCVWKT